MHCGERLQSCALSSAVSRTNSRSAAGERSLEFEFSVYPANSTAEDKIYEETFAIKEHVSGAIRNDHDEK